jgi:hypothetical protein
MAIATAAGAVMATAMAAVGVTDNCNQKGQQKK